MAADGKARAGLGAGYLPPGYMDAITTAVGQAEKHLRALLRPGGQLPDWPLVISRP